jgi:FkbM family methyltransferase
MIRSVRNTLRRFGVDLVRYRPLADRSTLAFTALRELRDARSGVEDSDFLRFCAKNLHRSRAQFMQDLFVLYQLNEKRQGYFVEFGATDGLTLSNTHLLEADYGWKGILAEPARCWHTALRRNRHVEIDVRAVWAETGKSLEFNEALWPDLSTINTFSNTDGHAAGRSRGNRYDVESVSLNDLLKDHGAPSRIDYLSLDTEGSEFDILANFDFENYEIRVITVEHNFTQNRDRILQLLSSKGYRRVLDRLSDCDDWYVRATT